MSYNTRQSYADNKRSNGAGAGEKRAPRVSTQESATRTSSFESRTHRSGPNSPVPPPERPSHKRTHSGNQRTNSMRSTEERERRIDKHIVTTRETLTSRVKSPERRHVPSMSVPNDKFRPSDGRRSAETRSREPREPTPQGTRIPKVGAHARREPNC